MPSEFRQVRLLLNTFNEWFIMTYFTIYINWFIYPRQGFGHYTKFTLKDKIYVSKKLKTCERGLYLPTRYCWLNCTAFLDTSYSVRLSEAFIIGLFSSSSSSSRRTDRWVHFQQNAGL